MKHSNSYEVIVMMAIGLCLAALLIITPNIKPATVIKLESDIPLYNESASNHSDYDYLAVLQAGHCTYDYNFKCNTFNSYKNKGTHGYGLKEQYLTLQVINEAKRQLLMHGYPVNKIKVVGAHLIRYKTYIGKSRVKHFVSVHFDGARKRCATGTSVGYPDNKRYDNSVKSKEHAQRWKEFYYTLYPKNFKKMRDNFSVNLSKYHMYTYTNTETDLLIELAELTCKKTSKWVATNVDKLGEVLAVFLANEINNAHKTSESDDIFR